jgi:hypothetical protein
MDEEIKPKWTDRVLTMSNGGHGGKFINNFEILIGQDSFRSTDPMLAFIINDRRSIVSLKEFKEWIDTIVESNGDRNPKAYAAFKNFKSVFIELLHPFMNYQKEDTSMSKNHWHIEHVKEPWISVKHKLPAQWGMYLLCYYRQNTKRLDYQVIHFNNKTNRFNTEYSDDEPRYWMPLPNPPIEDTHDE